MTIAPLPLFFFVFVRLFFLIEVAEAAWWAAAQARGWTWGPLEAAAGVAAGVGGEQGGYVFHAPGAPGASSSSALKGRGAFLSIADAMEAEEEGGGG